MRNLKNCGLGAERKASVGSGFQNLDGLGTSMSQLCVDTSTVKMFLS